MEDWRLTNQLDYLFREKLIRKNFLDFPEKEHEHCSFCWGKFGDDENMYKFGYCTKDAYHWICDKCFEDFKDMFEWSIESN